MEVEILYILITDTLRNFITVQRVNYIIARRIDE